MDIRSWLSPGAGKSTKPPVSKRKAAILSDDDEDDFASTGKKAKPGKQEQASSLKCKKEVSRKKINYIDSSDSDTGKASQPVAKKKAGSTSRYFDSGSSSTVKPSLASKEVSASDFFGSAKVSQTPAPKAVKKPSATKTVPETPPKACEVSDEEDPLNDADFEAALIEAVDAVSPARQVVKETPEQRVAASSPRRSSRLGQSPVKIESPHVGVSSPRRTSARIAQSPKHSPARPLSVASPTKASLTVEKRPPQVSSPLSSARRKLQVDSPVRASSPVSKRSSQPDSKSGNGLSFSKIESSPAAKSSIATPSRAHSSSKVGSSPAGKSSVAATPSQSPNLRTPGAGDDTSPAPPLSRKRSFYEFQNREGPRSIGSRALPEGAENCLAGLTFIITGVLETVEREDAQELVTRHGGKLTQTVGKRTSYMVVGRDPGPAKMEKAEKLGLKTLTEEEFFQLIESLPAKAYDSSGAAAKGKGAAAKKAIVLGISPEEEASSAVANKKKKDVPLPAKKRDEIPSVTVKKDDEIPLFTVKKEIPSVTVKKAPDTLGKDPTTTKASSSTIAPSLSSPSGGGLSAKMKSASKPASDSGEPDSLLWVDKYRPLTLRQLIGQQGDRSNMNKLLKWLRNWHRNLASYSGRPDRDSGAGFRAALLSGPPGIGKTTTATLVCKEAGFHYVELNASDTRSKNSLQTVVAQSLDNQTIDGMLSAHTQKESQECNALLMDEVDGMAGNEDRGGMQELVQLIKGTKMPIICMCNDRNSQKIRSLANYCFDLRFQRPRVEQIRGAMLSVACREGISIKPPVLDLIINAANNDIRQVLHHLYLWSIRDHTVSYDQAKEDTAKAEKHLKMSPFEVIRKVFSHETGRQSLNDQLDLFFQDYSLMPLFVQEMYPKVRPSAAKSQVQTLECLADAADSISQSDLVDKRVRSANAWGLLPLQGMLSTVVPGMIMRGSLGAQVEFPSWLGKRSRQTKCERLLQEVSLHCRIMTSVSKVDMGLDMAPQLQKVILHPLLTQGSAGVPDSVEAMCAYALLRDDLDSLSELCSYPPKEDPFAKLDPKTKSAFTRLYNKISPNTTYSVTGVLKKRKAKGPAMGDLGEDDEAAGSGAESDESDEDVAALLQKKKKVKVAGGSAASGRGGSRGGGHGRGGRRV